MASLIPNTDTRECTHRRIEFSFRGHRLRFKIGQQNARDGQDVLFRFETLIMSSSTVPTLTLLWSS